VAYLEKQAIKGLSILQTKNHRELHSRLFCPAAKLVIEADGGQHLSGAGEKADITRDEFMKNHGLKVRRVNNLDVLQNLEGVVEIIVEDLEIPLNPPYK